MRNKWTSKQKTNAWRIVVGSLLLSSIGIPATAQGHLLRMSATLNPLEPTLHAFALPATFSDAGKTKVPGQTFVFSKSIKLSADAAISVTSDVGPLTVEGFERVVTPRAIELSAGTYGDPSRFVATMAGVLTDNDQRNDFLVRGGNPAENLFVIDNIEIPSINQLALSDTTGGFVSMLDEAAVRGLTLHDDAFSSGYESRLSSVVDISTRTYGAIVPSSQWEVGIDGAGGSVSRPLGREGAYFLSARQGMLQYLTKDIGMNGVPKYRNLFARAENRFDDRDSWWGMSLTGIDSIVIHPDNQDPDETNPFDITYSGWRNTTGLNWQHEFSASSFAILSLAHAEQSQTVNENGQLQSGSIVYHEQSSDAVTTLKYDWTGELCRALKLKTGARGSLDQMRYAVAQPIGLQNPYSINSEPVDATAFDHHPLVGSSAAYAELSLTAWHGIQASAGGRAEHWALGGFHAWTGNAGLGIPVWNGRLLSLSVAERAQLPATLYLMAFDNIHKLGPMRALQFTAGMQLMKTTHVGMKVEAFSKRYTHYPVAQNYPELSMANVADTFGQAFLMFPMESAGRGLANGVEVTMDARVRSRWTLTVGASYARNWFSGLDGILRRGNYDIPLAANLGALYQAGKGFVISARYNVTSGRPYTPFALDSSLAQNRGIYDLSKVNAQRSPYYGRLDVRVEKSHEFGHVSLTWHAGLQNAFDRKNFYEYAWLPLQGNNPNYHSTPISEQDQMPIFPDGGLTIRF